MLPENFRGVTAFILSQRAIVQKMDANLWHSHLSLQCLERTQAKHLVTTATQRLKANLAAYAANANALLAEIDRYEAEHSTPKTIEP